MRARNSYIGPMAFLLILGATGTAVGMSFPFEPPALLQPPVQTRASEEMAMRPRASLDGPSPSGVQDLPTLRRESADKVENRWMAVKTIRPLTKQFRAVERRGLQRYAADNLVPVTHLGEAFKTTFQRRDYYRERIYGAPEMISLLGRAAELIEERQPGTLITVGDVAQPGGGQIPYGARIEHLTDGILRTPASNFLRRSTNDYDGAMVERRLVDGMATYPDEPQRFREFNDPILVERKLI